MPAPALFKEDFLDRLFVPHERWGWEYVDPGSPRPSALANSRPQWVEPPGADVREIEHRRLEAREDLPRKVTLVAILTLTGLSFITDGGLLFLLAAVGAGYYWFSPILMASQRMNAAQAAAAARRQAAYARFQQERGAWQQRVRAHDDAERQRLARECLYYPLQLQSAPGRVDVFGGTAEGWSALLATAGSSALASGRRLLVLDFTQQDASSDLSMLARQRGFNVSRHDLPVDFRSLDLLQGLDAEDIGELVADAVLVGRQSADGRDLHALDADLVRQVVDCLKGTITFGRIAAGLQVLQRIYQGGPDGPLSLDEEARLADRVDCVGQSERVQNELRHLATTVDLLSSANNVSANHERSGLDTAAALTVIATTDRNSRRKRLTDAVVFHTVLHHIRLQTDVVAEQLLVVAGADHLGGESLEELSSQARRRGLRLVYLLEHLRGDLEQLLGGSDSAALFMRLGNAKEAAAAAEFIGRGHKFVLSQLNQSFGETQTVGQSTSTAVSDSVTVTRGSNWGTGHGPGGRTSNSGGSSSEAHTRGTTHTYGENTSTAGSVTRGTVDSRTYEFEVEPTQLQSLAPTAFVLVDTGAAGRRAVPGDCEPNHATLERTADSPRVVRGRARSEAALGNAGGVVPPPRAAAEPAPEQHVRSMLLTDATGDHSALADRLRRQGFDVQYEQGSHPMERGWRVSRHDKLPFSPMDQSRIDSVLASR